METIPALQSLLAFAGMTKQSGRPDPVFSTLNKIAFDKSRSSSERWAAAEKVLEDWDAIQASAFDDIISRRDFERLEGRLKSARDALGKLAELCNRRMRDVDDEDKLTGLFMAAHRAFSIAVDDLRNVWQATPLRTDIQMARTTNLGALDAASQIDAFIRAVSSVFAYANLTALTIGMPPVPADDKVSLDIRNRELWDAENNRQDARKKAITIATELAQQLEIQGVDPSLVLTIRHRLDGGGGHAAIATDWEQLKVELQRIAIRLRTGLPAAPRRTGGDVIIRAGNATPWGDGASVEIRGGIAGPHGPGGNVVITGGSGGSAIPDNSASTGAATEFVRVMDQLIGYIEDSSAGRELEGAAPLITRLRELSLTLGYAQVPLEVTRKERDGEHIDGYTLCDPWGGGLSDVCLSIYKLTGREGDAVREHSERREFAPNPELRTELIRILRAWRRDVGSRESAAPIAVTTPKPSDDIAQHANGDKAGARKQPPDRVRSLIRKLNSKQCGIIRALVAEKAFDRESKWTRDQIANKLDKRVKSAKGMERDFSALRDWKLSDSAKGQDGGIWLTAKGRAVGEQLAANDGANGSNAA